MANSLKQQNHRPTYQPWYESDFWTLRVRRMHPMARLLYRALLQAAWDLEMPCLIKNDLPTIMAMCDCPDKKTWDRHGKSVMDMFDLSEDGSVYTNQRQMEELQKFYTKQASWSDRGKKGNEARWSGKRKKTRTNSSNSDDDSSLSIAKGSQKDALAINSDQDTISQPNQSSTSTKPTPGSSNAGRSRAQLLASPPEWLPIQTWNAFLESRKKLKAPATEEAARRLVGELGKLRTKGHSPEAVLNESIMRGWRGVFPLKDQTASGNVAIPRGKDANAEFEAQLGLK